MARATGRRSSNKSQSTRSIVEVLVLLVVMVLLVRFTGLWVGLGVTLAAALVYGGVSAHRKMRRIDRSD